MGNARVLGMEEDADLHGIRFNLTLTGFYISYIVFEMYVSLRVHDIQALTSIQVRRTWRATNSAQESG